MRNFSNAVYFCSCCGKDTVLDGSPIPGDSSGTRTICGDCYQNYLEKNWLKRPDSKDLQKSK